MGKVLKDIDRLAVLIEKGKIIGIPLNNWELVEELKDFVYPKVGPIAVGINFTHNMFFLQRDSELPEKLWY